MKTIAILIASAIGLATPAFAQASPAYLTEDVPLFAGPDQDYPQVDTLGAGSPVDIQGCTPGWQWCDVIVGDERGWVPGEALEVQYEQQWVPAIEYAPAYGIPVVTFSIRNYWDSYYRYRPFYVQRVYWYRWRPPYRPWQHRHGPYLPPPRVMPLPHPIHGNPPPRVVPMPHPIYGNPPPRVVPMPHPVYGNPPPRVVPMPHPTYGNPPPRVVPMPHPAPERAAPARRPQPEHERQ